MVRGIKDSTILIQWQEGVNVRLSNQQTLFKLPSIVAMASCCWPFSLRWIIGGITERNYLQILQLHLKSKAFRWKLEPNDCSNGMKIRTRLKQITGGKRNAFRVILNSTQIKSTRVVQSATRRPFIFLFLQPQNIKNRPAKMWKLHACLLIWQQRNIFMFQINNGLQILSLQKFGNFICFINTLHT